MHDETPKSQPKLATLLSLRCLVLLMAFMSTLGLLSCVLPKPTYSEHEKRNLAAMPQFSFEAFFGGTYLKDFEAHYADTFPFRESFIQLSAFLEECKGFRGADDVKIYGGNSQNAAPDPPVQSSTPEASQAEPMPQSSEEAAPASSSAPNDGSSSQQQTPASGSQPQQPPQSSPASESASSQAPPQVPDGYMTNGCVVSGDRACYLFGGYKPGAQLYAQYISEFADRVEGLAKVYNIVVPTSGEFYLPQKYKAMSNSQKENIDYLYGFYQNSNVIPVDAYSWLEMNTDKYIYFRTDHHWTAEGAYYAYVAFCREAGINYPSLHELEKHTIENFKGTIYGETRDAKLGANPDYVDYYITATNYKAQMFTKQAPTTPYPVPAWADFAQGGNAYSVFIYGDNPVFQMDNLDIENGDNVLLLKDSYGNAFAPFLMASYDKVFVIDYRHYENSLFDFIVDNDIETVIFLNNSMAANTVYHADRIRYLATQ